MKKLIAFLFTSFFLFLIYTDSQAQIVKAGIGLMYGTEVEQLGVRVDGVYQINDDFRFVADLGIYFPDKTEFGDNETFTLTWWELNTNANYIFYSDETEGVTAYALGGLNFTTIRAKYENGPQESYSESDTEVGLNLGAGIEYALDFAELFGEIKFVLGDADQLNIGVGFRFPF